MKSIAKLAAPVALALAAVGVQASEVGPLEHSAQPMSRPAALSAQPSQPSQVAARTSTSGEVAPGDIITSPVSSGTRAAPEVPTIAAPAVGVYSVGA